MSEVINDLPEKLKKALRRDLHKADITRTEFAKKLNISNQAITNWMTGANLPRRQNIREMVAIFGKDSELVKLLEQAAGFEDERQADFVLPDGSKIEMKMGEIAHKISPELRTEIDIELTKISAELINIALRVAQLSAKLN